ncbi:MAG: hypothetical protein ACFFDB_00015 [Promethearchaeota archaeon]
MNNQHKVFIIGIVILSAVIIPYSLLFMGELVNESTSEEDLSSDGMEKVFPQSYISYIKEVDFIYGENSSQNSLEDLKSDDNEYYGIQAEWVSPYYQIDIQFKFDIIPYPVNLWLFLKIEQIVGNEIYYLQYKEDNQWKNLTEIEQNEIEFNNYYLNSTSEFRIYGISLLSKEISIDQIFIFKKNRIEGEILDNNFLYSNLELNTTHNGYKGFNIDLDQGSKSGSSPTYYTFDVPNDWYYTENYIYQDMGQVEPLMTINRIETDLHVSMVIDLNDSYNIASDFSTNWSLGVNFYYQLYDPYAQYGYANVYIWDYTANDWSNVKHTGHGGSYNHTWSNADGLDLNDFIQKDINGNYTWKFRIHTYNAHTGGHLRNVLKVYNAPIQWDFASYPIIEQNSVDLYTLEIQSHINPQANFISQSIYEPSTISKTEYYITNPLNIFEVFLSGSLEYSGYNDLYNDRILRQLIENGEYDLWILVNDSNGFMSFNNIEFSVTNDSGFIKQFPEDYFQNITNIEFKNGSLISGDLNSLVFEEDGDKLIINPTPITSYYYYDVRFQFSDLDSYPMDYYDLYIYLDIDAPLFESEKVYFQVKTVDGLDYKWDTLFTIGNNATQIERYYIQRGYEFRIYAQITSVKQISIDRIRFLPAHTGSFISTLFTIDDTILDYYQLPYDSIPFSAPDDWWEIGGSYIKCWGNAILGTWASSGVDIEMNLTNAKIIDFKQPNSEDILVYLSHGILGTTGYRDIFIWNYTQSDWNFINRDTTSFATYENLTYGLDGITIKDMINRNESGQNYWRFKVDARVDGKGAGNSDPESHLNLYEVISNVKVDAYEIAGQDYPEIDLLYTDPSTPITSVNFDVRARVYPRMTGSTITKVRCLLMNSTWKAPKWETMDYIGGDVYSINFKTEDYTLGDYTVWVEVIDSKGLSTFDVIDITLKNERPRISFTTPSEENEKVSQLYGYDIIVNIVDPELEDYFNVSFKFYKNDPENPLIDWSNMTRIATTSYWNFTIDPINYTNGLYHIIVRASDYLGYGYNETIILIENNAPQVDILSPTVVELILPGTWKVICNISNEEPINSAQWDIVKVLDSFMWKNLTFNSSSTYWESNFSLLNYSYGDYYLVINATDDKYNSSLEIKSIQIHPLITYYIPQISISYIKSDIKVSNIEANSDDITADFQLFHHSIAMERDFEIYLPGDYKDAHNYYLTRDYNTYTPIGFFTEGVYTLWKLPYWQSSDIIHFNLDKPRIVNNPFEESDYNYELTFSLSAKHNFTNLEIENQLEEYISKPENYEFKLFYNYQGDWIEIEEGFEVEQTSGTIKFNFPWKSIDANTTIEFRFTATQLNIEETDWTPIIVGATLGAFGIGISVFIIFGFKKHEDWGKAKAILLSIGIGAAAGITGYFIVLFI